MRRRRIAILAALVLLPLSPLAVTAPAAAAPVSDPTSYVNPFVGTEDGGTDFGHGGGAGNNFPGAVMPFGMMQWSPDTVTTAGGGYKYEDDRLRGFSMTHISGPGCLGAQDFPVTPISGTIGRSPATHGDDYVRKFSHKDERAAPGYYGVTDATGVKTELTTSTRAGVARFTFPADKDQGTLLLNVTGSINGVDDAEATVHGNTVYGRATTGGFCGADTRYHVYFQATFDRPIKAFGTWKNDSVQAGETTARGAAPARVKSAPERTFGHVNNGPSGRPLTRSARTMSGDVNVKGPGSGVYLTFGSGKPVQMRSGISFVSVDGAERNLASEIGSRGFDTVRSAAHAAWRKRLDQVRVSGGADTELRTFYTALYHALLQPYVFDDVDGTYTGFDDRTHRVRRGHHQYATFSGWDIYRSEAQLLAFLAPDVASDIAQSMYGDAHSIGDVWDRWSHQNTITGVMVGDPYHSIVSSAYAFGARDFDAGGALASMVAGANRIGEKSGYTERPGNAAYLERGYVPGDPSTTLEYGLADFGIAQLASRLGRTGTASAFMKRAQSWQNLYNPANDWIQPRNADGSFLTPFDPADSSHYVEGNGAQYHWMTYQNVHGLFAAMGGRAAAAKRLDTFFTKLNAGSHEAYAYLGNEPSLQSPWLYAWTGTPYKTQDVVRKARTTLYKPTPDGLVGNDDLGTMSAWYVWASIGMYPVTPGRAEMVVNGPAFPKVEIRRSSGQTVTINAPGATAATPYVKSLKVNGSASDRLWLPESFARSGGRLDYVMSGQPSPGLGASESAEPPSYGEGARSSLASVDPGTLPLEPGSSASVTLRVRSLGDGGAVSWSAKPPAGITVSPSSGSVDVPAHGQADQKVTLTAAPDAALEPHAVPFEVSGAGQTGVTVNVARRGTIGWYQNNAGISADGAAAQADFDGGGWSYSSQALSAAGAAPGASIPWNGFTFGWPSRKPGQYDNVQASGQTVEFPSPPEGSQLAFLGAAGNGDAESTVTLTYTDGSTQAAPLSFSDWALGADAYDPRFGNETVLKTPYRNNSDGTKDELNVYIFGATPISLEKGKTLKSFTLNKPKDPAAGTLHIFAWSFK